MLQKVFWSNSSRHFSKISRHGKNMKAYSYDELPKPIKSENDKKNYKVIKLKNGLRACLISDPGALLRESSFTSIRTFTGNEDNISMKKFGDVSQAAAALCIGVGSFSDPPEAPGLAHFLEHMVFMGSKKFPNENDFESFISKHGGYTNASTDCETTTFYFECLPKHLDQALERFAQFFISPLMKKSSIQKEREIVDSEFQMVMAKDAYRKEQLLLNLMNPKVPINSFTWGNLQTLKTSQLPDDTLYKMLHEFRERHFSANRMTLAIQSTAKLEELIQLIMKHFSDIPNNKMEPLNFQQYKNIIFNHANFKKIYYMQPVNDIIQVDISWALPPIFDYYKNKPIEYICSLIGDEGKNSLISFLKKQMWALALTATVDDNGYENCSIYSILSISIVLTSEGRKKLYNVIESVFAYIKLLQENGPQEMHFKELKTIEETAFKYYEEQDAVDIVEDLAIVMQYFPSEHYLIGPNQYFEYNPKLIAQILSMLTPENMNIIVMTQQLPPHIKTFDKLEKWFKTPYTDEAIPKKWVQDLNNVKVPLHFSLPSPNPFLTQDFKLFEVTSEHNVPYKLIDNDLCEIWFKQDNKFRLPIACYYYYFITPYAVDSPRCACLMDLYVNILSLQLMEEAYPAYVAELNFTISSDDDGVLLKVDGYNSKLPAVIDLICKHIMNFQKNLTPEFFQVMKIKQRSLYYNSCLRTTSLLRELRMSTIQDKHFTSLDKHCCIDNISHEEMIEFSESFLKKIWVQGLIMGNLNTNIAMKTTKRILDSLKCQPVDRNAIYKRRILKVPLGDTCCRIQSINDEDNSTIITNYYQGEPFNMKTSITIELLMLIMEEPLFDTLRTKEQLGYHVYNQIRETEGILGFTITVHSQATKFNPTYIDNRIEEFLKEIGQYLDNMNDEKFQQYKKDLIKIKQLKELHLDEEVEKFWSEIFDRDYMFDRAEQEVQAIKSLSLAEMQKWYATHTATRTKEEFRKISFQVVGSKTGKQEKITSNPSSHCSTKCAPRSSKCAKLYNSILELEKDTLKLDHNLKFLGDQQSSTSIKRTDYFLKSIDEFKKHAEFYPPKVK